MSERGWCPFARQHRGYGREGPFGYPAGTRNQNRPVIFVDHRMGGFKRTLDNDQWRYDNWVGVHAGVGRDGSLDQYTNIFDASWANGVSGSVQRYDRANPRLAELEFRGRWIAVPYAGTTGYALVAGGVNVLNASSISTEHEDETRDQPWTPAEVETTIRWHAWCLTELAAAGMPMAVDEWMLVRHGQIDPVNRPGCPGTHYPKTEILEALGAGGDELFVRYPPTLEDTGIAKWPTGIELAVRPTDYVQQLGVDLPKLPANVAALDVEVILDPTSVGELIYKDGDGRHAGLFDRFYRHGTVHLIAINGTVRLGVSRNPVRVTSVRCLGYYQ